MRERDRGKGDLPLHQIINPLKGAPLPKGVRFNWAVAIEIEITQELGTLPVIVSILDNNEIAAKELAEHLNQATLGQHETVWLNIGTPYALAGETGTNRYKTHGIDDGYDH